MLTVTSELRCLLKHTRNIKFDVVKVSYTMRLLVISVVCVWMALLTHSVIGHFLTKKSSNRDAKNAV